MNAGPPVTWARRPSGSPSAAAARIAVTGPPSSSSGVSAAIGTARKAASPVLGDEREHPLARRRELAERPAPAR